MSHQVYRNNVAFVGETPWHGIGRKMNPNASLDEWIQSAGFDFEILRGKTLFEDSEGRIHKGLGEHLYRSDTLRPMSNVSKQYKIVQPAEVMDFFREVCSISGFSLETAGVLKGGGVYWGLAKTSASFRLKGDDRTDAYVLLATSADKSLRTVGVLTGVRVVCWNTLSAAVSGGAEKMFGVIHTAEFDQQEALETLGLADYKRTFEEYGDQLATLARKPMSRSDVSDFFSELLRPGSVEEMRKAEENAKLASEQAQGHADFHSLIMKDANLSNVATIRTDGGRFLPEHVGLKQRTVRGLDRMMDAYENAPGACPGTAYGALQGVTYYIDHFRGQDQSKRLHSAWFGQGDTMKTKAFEQLISA